MSSRTSLAPVSPNTSVLRHRAAALRTFAGTIDRLLVTRVDAQELSNSDALAGSHNWYMRQQLLEHNLHQLHRAADELRDTAHKMWQCADSLEHSHITARPDGTSAA